MSFLDPNYQVPTPPSSYMKFKPGPNRFRILGSAIVGYVYWNIEGKPVRLRTAPKLIPPDIRINKKTNMPEDIKHFWAFPVWNYNDNMIQILEITQARVQRSMKTKIDNRGGNATNYDWTITKEGDGFDTVYDVDVSDSSPLAPEIAGEYTSKTINLDALFEGGDPFKASAALSQPQTSPHTQNAPMDVEKLQGVANQLKNHESGPVGQNEPVAPDVAEAAAKLEADYNAEDHEGVPFN
jgi:hypothetical protein